MRVGIGSDRASEIGSTASVKGSFRSLTKFKDCHAGVYTAMSRMCASGQSCGEFVGCEALVFWQPRALLSTLSSHYTILGNPILALVSSGIPVSPSSQIGVRWVSDHEMDT